MGEEDVEKPHEQELGASSKENVSTQSPAPASAPAVATGSARLGAASSRERSAPWQVVEKKSAKGASKSASKGASKGASKVDRNALSARGTGSPKRKLEEVKPSSPAAASPQGSSPGASSLLSGGAGSMDDESMTPYRLRRISHPFPRSPRPLARCRPRRVTWAQGRTTRAKFRRVFRPRGCLRTCILGRATHDLASTRLLMVGATHGFPRAAEAGAAAALALTRCGECWCGPA